MKSKWMDKTRGGYEYRIYAEDGGGTYPIHGAVWEVPEQAWRMASWQPNGRYKYTDESRYDLLPAKKRRWKTAEELVQDWKNGDISDLSFNADGIIQVWKHSYGQWKCKSARPEPINTHKDPQFLEVFTTEEE